MTTVCQQGLKSFKITKQQSGKVIPRLVLDWIKLSNFATLNFVA